MELKRSVDNGQKFPREFYKALFPQAVCIQVYNDYFKFGLNLSFFLFNF